MNSNDSSPSHRMPSNLNQRLAIQPGNLKSSSTIQINTDAKSSNFMKRHASKEESLRTMVLQNVMNPAAQSTEDLQKVRQSMHPLHQSNTNSQFNLRDSSGGSKKNLFNLQKESPKQLWVDSARGKHLVLQGGLVSHGSSSGIVVSPQNKLMKTERQHHQQHVDLQPLITPLSLVEVSVKRGRMPASGPIGRGGTKGHTSNRTRRKQVKKLASAGSSNMPKHVFLRDRYEGSKDINSADHDQKDTTLVRKGNSLKPASMKE